MLVRVKMCLGMGRKEVSLQTRQPDIPERSRKDGRAYNKRRIPNSHMRDDHYRSPVLPQALGDLLFDSLDMKKPEETRGFRGFI